MVKCSGHPSSIARKKKRGQRKGEGEKMETDNTNRCMHEDCFTCPYEDCILEMDSGEDKTPDFDCALRD